MLKISANDAQLTVVACGPITSDRIDLPCEITLSPEFDGLAVTVVFKAGDVQRDVAMLGSPVHVPAECLEQAGEVLMVGIWAGDGSGRPTIPTVWASAGTIRTGVLPSGIDPSTPEPDWAAQVQQAAAQAVATANSVRADADAGVFDGEDGYSPTATVEQLADGATITITDKDGTTTATVHDGTNGRDGTDGVDGFSPTATVTQTAAGATISITDKSGTTTASVSNGTDGTDGTDGFSPTVDVQPITGGHEVTITDADGAHSFDVMDGDPAAPGSITDEMLAPDGIKAQVAQLWGNQLVGIMSGTIDTADDAYAAPPMALTVDGASTQASYTGKNLFDKSTVASGYLRPDGTVASSSTTYHSAKIPVAGLSQVTCNGLATVNSVGAIIFYDESEEIVQAIVGASGKSTRTEEVPETATSAIISFTYSLIDTVQFEAGTTATSYEPYTGGKPSPSPDYPQPVLNVDALALVLAGKNLCPTADGTTIASDWTREGQNCIKYIGLTVDNATLTLSCTMNGVPSTTGSNNRLYVTIPGAQSKFCDLNTAGAKSVTVAGSGIVQLGINHNSVDSFGADMLLKNIQLELGSTATDYEPYTGQSVPLLPEGTSLRYLPDSTRDTLNLSYLCPSTRAGWAWYSRSVVQKVGSVTYDGSESWNYEHTTLGYENFYIVAPSDSAPSTFGNRILCTHGVGHSEDGYAVPDCVFISPRGNMNLTFGNTLGINTAAGFKMWLASNNVTVQYILATPVTTTLDPIELPELPAPNCTVWCDGGSATPTYTMEYVQDTNIVIADLRAALADLATS